MLERTRDGGGTPANRRTPDRRRSRTRRSVEGVASRDGHRTTQCEAIERARVEIAGVAFATRFGNSLSLMSSVALIAFGTWISISSLRELRGGSAHRHDHDRDHDRDESSRTTLFLILGSSPMVEGIPAFFAAGKFGPGLVAIMAAVFAIATIATYVALCVSSAAGLQRLRFGAFERYGEVLSGAFVAAIGLVFLFVPIA